MHPCEAGSSPYAGQTGMSPQSFAHLRNFGGNSLMWKDPIVEEVRKVREAHAAQFDYNLDAIYRDLKEQERKSGRTFTSYSAKRIVPVTKNNAV